MKCLQLNNIKNSEDCAYTAARFKRKIDKKFNNNCSINTMLDTISRNAPSNVNISQIEKFKQRVYYYYINPDKKPPKPPKSADSRRYDIDFICSKGIARHNGQLDDMPVRALIGCIEVACSPLFYILAPYIPGAAAVATFLVTHGVQQIYEGYFDENNRNQKAGSTYYNTPGKKFDLDFGVNSLAFPWEKVLKYC